MADGFARHVPEPVRPAYTGTGVDWVRGTHALERGCWRRGEGKGGGGGYRGYDPAAAIFERYFTMRRRLVDPAIVW